jgi:hypothetical protein
MAREIPVTGGHVALVDDCDYERVSAVKWYMHKNRGGGIYARGRVGPERRLTLMRRFILGATGAESVDHRDGNTLNNTRENLRLATTSQNMMNSAPKKGRRFKGVFRYNRGPRWLVLIGVDGRQRRVGVFDSEEDAARAYDGAARKLHGEFARLNFPEAS